MPRLILALIILFTNINYPLLSSWELMNRDIGIGFGNPLPMEYAKEYGRIIFPDGKFLYYSTDLGKSWIQDTNALTRQAISFVRKDSTIVLSSNKLISVVQSTDLGKTWHPRIEGLGSGDSSKLIHSVLGLKDDYVFLGTLNHLYRSKIGGEDRWEEKINFVGLESWKVIIPKAFLTIDDKIFVGTNNIGVWVSTDNGESWYPRNNGLTFMAVFDLQYFEGYMYAATYGGGVCRSSDFGETWEDITKNFTNLAQANKVYAEGNIIIASSAIGSGNYISKDFGKSWFIEPYSLAQYLTTSISSFLRIDEYLYATFKAYGIYRIKWDNLVTSISDNGINYNIFPNPARSTTQINLHYDGEVTISAADILGRSYPLWSGYATAGEKELDVSSLPSGTYNLLINYGTKIEAVRMIKE